MSKTFLPFLLFIVALLFSGCGISAQKGGWVRYPGAAMQQGENAATPSTLEQHQNYERSYVIPAGSELVTWSVALPEVPGEIPHTNFSAVRISAPVVMTEKRSSGAQSQLGAAQKDEARSLGAKLKAMKPVQWTGIALCVASIAAFYFGWPSLGFLAIACGAGMITVAAVVPGHEKLILGVGGVAAIVTALVVVYAYSKGKLDADGNGIPDFLEKKRA